LATDDNRKPFLSLNKRYQSIAVFAFFFSWLLAVPFEGQVFYSLADYYHIDPLPMIYGAIWTHFLGLFSIGFFIKTFKAAKRLMQFSISFCMLGSVVFFFTPSILWNISLFVMSYLAGGCVASWGFYFKAFTPSNERFKTAADVLIYSNILMIVMNMMAIHFSPKAGLTATLVVLGLGLFFMGDLSEKSESNRKDISTELTNDGLGDGPSLLKPLAFLCLFVVVITINSGLMYQVINPAYEHHAWLVSWYWAVPYIVALYIMKNLPRKTNRTYILYVAIAMIGLSFISFMILDRSAASYLLVNTLMLGACGVYDLFWWSILGEMLDYDKNPAKILGIGLSANVLGVLLGGMLGNAISTTGVRNYNAALLALGVVCITLVILPPLHKHLAVLLTNHAFLTDISAYSPQDSGKEIDNLAILDLLTERENQIAVLLIKGKTYKMIANELYVSENTIKTHIKNIYAKFNIKSRMELVNLMIEKERF